MPENPDKIADKLGVNAPNSQVNIENLFVGTTSESEKSSVSNSKQKKSKQKTHKNQNKNLTNRKKEILISRSESLKISQNQIIFAQRSLDEIQEISLLTKHREVSLEDHVDFYFEEAVKNFSSGQLNQLIQHRIILEDIVESFSKLSVDEELTNRIYHSKKYRKIYDRSDLDIERKVEFLKEILSSSKEISKCFEPPTLEEKIYLISNLFSIEKEELYDFLNGEILEKSIFMKISDCLNLNPLNLTDFDFLETLIKLTPKIKSCHYGMIKNQCGVLRILDCPSPVELTDFFVDVNILSEPIKYRKLTVSELPKVYDSAKNYFDRWVLSATTAERISGISALSKNSRLMILGKPGSGKTSFLKHVAMQCIKENFMRDFIPLFVELKEFAKALKKQSYTNLYDYFENQLCNSDEYDVEDIARVFNHGRILILLDGLDEVSENDSFVVEESIIQFCREYYRNHVVITCRTAAIGDEFADFTYVEVADFEDQQIQRFARNWFIAVEELPYEKALEKSKHFLKVLNQDKNQQIKEIAVTPILLSLTCLVFQSQSKFPSKRAILYEEALDILLRKWDRTKRLIRDDSYRNLSVEQKIDLLSYIATITFENGRFFFEKHEVVSHIVSYFESLKVDGSNKQNINAEAVLKSIEIQHGLLIERARNIYSFCQLTFQEYFTAKSVIKGFGSRESQDLFGEVSNKSWREIFLLSTELVGDPEHMILGIKKSVDGIIDQNTKIQNYINWVKKKAFIYREFYSLEALRAFYLTIGCPELMGRTSFEAFFSSSLATALDSRIKKIFQIGLWKSHILKGTTLPNHERQLAIELTLARVLFFTLNLDSRLLNEMSKLSCLCLEPKKITFINQSLLGLQNSLNSKDKFNKKKISAWLPRLRQYMTSQYNIGHEWHFDKSDKQILRKYYSSVTLLHDCLSIEDRVEPFLKTSIIQNLIT